MSAQELSKAAVQRPATPIARVVPQKNNLYFPINSKTWTNWAETARCTPTYFHVPESRSQLRTILQHARAHKEPVRVLGSGHSPSDIATTDGHAISLSRFARVIHVDKNAAIVTAEAGIVVHILNDKLAEAGLALSNLGSIADQTLGGLLMTGTHGTGVTHGILATQVIELEIMLADGTEVTCSAAHEPDLFKAALCSLVVTVRCEPLFRLSAVQYPYPLHLTLLDYENIARSAEHSRFWWFPHTDHCIIWKANRSTESAVRQWPLRQRLQSIKNKLVGYYSLEFAYWLSLNPGFDRLVPYINKLYRRLLFNHTESSYDLSYKVFTFDCLFKQYVCEWSLPIENGRKALLELKRLIESNDYKVHFPVEVRFVRGDDIWLSPSYGGDRVYIGLIMYRPYGREVEYAKYFDAAQVVFESLGGRPHWAKAHTWEFDQCARNYPKWEDFVVLREKLDPGKIFWNAYVDRVFTKHAK